MLQIKLLRYLNQSYNKVKILGPRAELFYLSLMVHIQHHTSKTQSLNWIKNINSIQKEKPRNVYRKIPLE